MIDPTSLLHKSVQLFADRAALVHEDRRLTYRQLWDRSVRLANALCDNGIEPGERVALLGDNSFEARGHITGLGLGGYVRGALYPHDVADRHMSLLGRTR